MRQSAAIDGPEHGLVGRDVRLEAKSWIGSADWIRASSHSAVQLKLKPIGNWKPPSSWMPYISESAAL